MVQHKAQDVADKPRTEDIQVSTDEDIEFKTMLLPKPILKGLNKCGYRRPSPIQRKALPLVRCGLDLIVQAKAGTGKTCVFTIAALELVQANLPHLQAVVLAPTREIALQITDVINAIGQCVEGLKTSCFIGGFPLSQDVENAKGCQIAVGAPGRMSHLMDMGLLNAQHVRLFVLDEADKLMEEAFVKDINGIFSYLPESKQVLACSATYTPELVQFLSCYMQRGQYVSPHTSTNTTVLLGLKQFVSVTPLHVNKLAKLRLKENHLLDILRFVPFNQCLVFTNIHIRAQSVCNLLRKQGLGVEWIAGRQAQADRVSALTQLREQRVRVLVTTDLTSRGIDVDNINLVINLDAPPDHHTYLHRMGRAGRYGSHGMVISIVSEGEELVAFRKMLGAIGGIEQSLHRVPQGLNNVNLWETTAENLQEVFGIVDSDGIPPEGSEQSCAENSTETDEKYSQASSDEESVTVNECQGVDAVEDDSCDLFETASSNIEVVPGPSLFTVSSVEEHWREVLPIEVKEDKVPLDTPVVLLGSKLIKVKFIERKKKQSEMNGSKSNVVVKFETKCDDVEFLNLEEISAVIENGVKLENDCASKNVSKGEILSAQEIGDVLENGVLQDSLEEKEMCKEIEKVFLEYQSNSALLMNDSVCFDSFDIVGWMAVDETHNILEDLKADELEIYEFCLVKSPSGKNCIKVRSSWNNSEVNSQKNDCGDILSALCLKSLNLSPPFSLASIAEKLAPKKVSRKPFKEPSKSKTNVNRHQKCNESHLKVSLKNGTTGMMDGKILKQKNGKETRDSWKTVQNNSKQTIKPANIEKTSQPSFGQKFATNGPIKNKKISSAHNSKGTSSITLNLSTQNDGVAGGTKSRENGIAKSEKALKTKNNSPKLAGQNLSCSNLKSQTSHKSDDLFKTSEVPSDSSRESDLNSSISSMELVSSSSRLNGNNTSSSREDSGPYVNMSRNLTKWREHRELDESESSDESIPKSLDRRETRLDSTSNSCKTPHSKGKDYHTKSNKKGKSKKAIERERSLSNDSSLSEATNRHSFITACSRPESDENVIKDSYIPSRCFNRHHDSRSQPSCSYSYTKVDTLKPTEKNVAKEEQFHPDRRSKSHFNGRKSHKRFEQNTFSDKAYHHESFDTVNRNHDHNQVPLKVISGSNLYSEWYSTWYLNVRLKAQELEMSEYLNTMTSP